MVHVLFVGVVCSIVGLFWGLVVALVIRWARKTPKMPSWPLVTGLLLGPAIALMQMAPGIR